MHHQFVRNVREALPEGLRLLARSGEIEDSRNGPVIVANGPVLTTYEYPGEMVLLSPIRDANPFFHLAESIWMLAGRNDAAFLDEYVKDFGARFAESDGRIHDAYGRRWRSGLMQDQLDVIVSTLIRDPSSRQCVLQMWDAYPRHGNATGHGDLGGQYRTRPCNTHVYLRVRRRPPHECPDARGGDPVLDMTLCCRSNDAVLGAHGANAVHFAVLQEYLAARVGVSVGYLHQFSNNYHVYVSELDRLSARIDDLLSKAQPQAKLLEISEACRTEETRPPGRVPLFTQPGGLDKEISALVAGVDTLHGWGNAALDKYVMPMPMSEQNGFLKDTWRALVAHRLHRLGEHGTALVYAKRVEHVEWRQACVEWLQRRAPK